VHCRAAEGRLLRKLLLAFVFANLASWYNRRVYYDGKRKESAGSYMNLFARSLK